MSELGKSFDQFIVNKYIEIAGVSADISKEQLEIIIHVYEQGFLDALKILKSENIINVHLYE